MRLDGLQTITRRAAGLLVAVGAVGLVLMTAIIGWQVFGRYVLRASPDWSEQASLTLMIWYVSFAAAAGVREGFHIRIVALTNALPARGRLALRYLSELVVLSVGVAMLIWSSQLVVGTWSHTIPTLGLPRGAAYLGLPIAGALIALFSAERILELPTHAAGEGELDEDPRWS
ncbi:MAG: TRAP transporter small permease [Pseudomonadota bacterium]